MMGTDGIGARPRGVHPSTRANAMPTIDGGIIGPIAVEMGHDEALENRRQDAIWAGRSDGRRSAGGVEQLIPLPQSGRWMRRLMKQCMRGRTASRDAEPRRDPLALFLHGCRSLIVAHAR
jgi:hypothetical protein